MNLSALCHGDPLPFEPGIYPNMSRSDYDRLPALSATVLKKWLSLGEIPSKFAYWMQTRWDEAPSEAMLIGNALDWRLLGGLFSAKYAVAPDVDRRTTAGKAVWNGFKAANKGKTVLTAGQAEKVEAMTGSVRTAETADGILGNCKKMVLCGELWGFPCKAEVDLFTPTSEHLLDLKTARDVSEYCFGKALIDLGYDCQASFYLSLARACGLKKDIFDFLCVENEAPWTCMVYSFDLEDLDHRLLFDACLIKLERAANEIVTRLQTNNFTNSKDWKLVKVPEWALHQAKLETLAIL
jgi:hypothetical protein